MRLFDSAFFRKVVTRHDTGMGESYMDGDYEVHLHTISIACSQVGLPSAAVSATLLQLQGCLCVMCDGFCRLAKRMILTHSLGEALPSPRLCALHVAKTHPDPPR